MSVFYVAQWSVNDATLDEHSHSLRILTEHTRSQHPLIEEVRLFRERWGPGPRHRFVWMERYASLALFEADCEPPACTCEEVWSPIYASAQDGTFVGSVWSDVLPDEWFYRGESSLATSSTKRLR